MGTPPGESEGIKWLYQSQSHVNLVMNDLSLQKANLAVAKQKRELTSVSHNVPKPKLLKAHRRTTLGDHGVGMQLYFDFMRAMALVFLVLGCLKIPQIVLTQGSSMLRLSAVYRSLLGNIGDQPDYNLVAPAVAAGLIRERPITIYGAHIPISAAVLAFGILDLVCTITVFGFMVWFLQYRIPDVCRENDRLRHTMADHTIMVHGLPPYLQENEHRRYRKLLKDHFLKILEERSDPVEGKRKDCIKECVIVRVDPCGINELLQIGKLKHEVTLIQARNLQGKEIKEKAIEKKLAKIETLIASVRDSTELPTKDRPVAMAFISFQHKGDKEFLVNTYKGSSWWLLEQSQASSLRFFGKPIKVEQAPEPEDILWENLLYPTPKRVRNVLIIWCVVVAVLAVSFFISSILERLGYVPPHRAEPAAQIWRLRRPLSGLSWRICDISFYSDNACAEPLSPPSFRAQYTQNRPSMTLIADSGMLPCTEDIWESIPASRMAGVEAWFRTPTIVGCVEFTQGLIDESGTIALDHVISRQATPGALEACDPLLVSGTDDYVPLCTLARSASLTTQNSWIMQTWNMRSTRYCPDVQTGENGWGGIEDSLMSNGDDLHNRDWYLSCYCLDGFAFDKIGVCTRFYAEYFRRNVALWAMLLCITLINTGLQYLIQWLVHHMEKPWSNSQRMALSCSKIFMAQYLNSGFNILLTTGHIFSRTLTVGEVEITGAYGDLSGGWYEEAGVRLMSFGFFHIAFPHLFMLFMPLVWKAWRGFFRSSALIQHDLDNLYRKPEFAIDSKVAGVVALASFMLTYTGPMPLLPFCGSAALGIMYWCDKFHFVYGSTKPPKYTEGVMAVATGLLQVALLVRTMISMSAFGHPLVSPSGSLGPGSHDFLDMIIDSAERENMQLTYEFVPPNSAALAPDWAYARFKAYTLSSASFPSTLYLIIVAFVALNIGVLTILYASRMTRMRRLLERWVTKVTEIVEPTAEEGTYDELQANMKGRVAVTSYRMTANPAYALIDRARSELRNASMAALRRRSTWAETHTVPEGNEAALTDIQGDKENVNPAVLAETTIQMSRPAMDADFADDEDDGHVPEECDSARCADLTAQVLALNPRLQYVLAPIHGRERSSPLLIDMSSPSRAPHPATMSELSPATGSTSHNDPKFPL